MFSFLHAQRKVAGIHGHLLPSGPKIQPSPTGIRKGDAHSSAAGELQHGISFLPQRTMARKFNGDGTPPPVSCCSIASLEVRPRHECCLLRNHSCSGLPSPGSLSNAELFPILNSLRVKGKPNVDLPQYSSPFIGSLGKQAEMLARCATRMTPAACRKD